MYKKPAIVIIYGPTGVGKTDFALQLANKIPAEIINMDVGQFYTSLTIGTAKPNLHTVPVPHHGFNIVHDPCDFTVMAYRTLCETLIAEIVQRGNIPIIVGGSGFYLQSLFFPPSTQLSKQLNVSQQLNVSINGRFDSNNYKQESDQERWEFLYTLDPARAVCIHPHDRYRVERALAIWSQTGEKPSTYMPYYNPIAFSYAHIIFLARDRTELYHRINQRVDIMMQEGWLEETKQFLDTPWEPFIRRKKIIGYNELIDYLRSSETDKTSVTMTIKQRTRHYAKRQFTFWRLFAATYARVNAYCRLSNQDYRSSLLFCSLDPALILESVNLTLPSRDLYINQLALSVSSFLSINQ